MRLYHVMSILELIDHYYDERIKEYSRTSPALAERYEQERQQFDRQLMDALWRREEAE